MERRAFRILGEHHNHARNRAFSSGRPGPFLNFRSEVVHLICFAIVFWDCPGDTLYEDRHTSTG
ncbi:hypothetical protein SAMN05518861_11663 [Mesorhizobium sp. YR577]|nr:hypothetical protein SAMN05518861_11663 [Mesorhizobium sp. YR577]